MLKITADVAAEVQRRAEHVTPEDVDLVLQALLAVADEDVITPEVRKSLSEQEFIPTAQGMFDLSAIL